MFDLKHFNDYYFTISKSFLNFNNFNFIMLICSFKNEENIKKIVKKMSEEKNYVILTNVNEDIMNFMSFSIAYEFLKNNNIQFKNITFLTSNIVPFVKMDLLINNDINYYDLICTRNKNNFLIDFLQMNYDFFLYYVKSLKIFNYNSFFNGLYQFNLDIKSYNMKIIGSEMIKKYKTKEIITYKDYNLYFKYNEIHEFGIIMLRHVVKIEHNKLWIKCYKNIRKFYPNISIIIIDDASDYNLITDISMSNVEIIQSEFPRRGELLPYLYLLKYKWFKKALFIHDSVFINEYLDIFCNDYMPLWHFNHLNNQYNDQKKILLQLENNSELIQYHDSLNWFGIFGGMTCIKLEYLEKINNNHNLFSLTNCIHNRYNRMSFERVLSVLLSFYSNNKFNSFYGDIHKYENYGTNYAYYDKIKIIFLNH